MYTISFFCQFIWQEYSFTISFLTSFLSLTAERKPLYIISFFSVLVARKQLYDQLSNRFFTSYRGKKTAVYHKLFSGGKKTAVPAAL
jgi:hypothetical protein